MIVIKRESKDKLLIKVWEFYFATRIHTFSLTIDRYYEQSRLTTRHKYVTNKQWDRIDKRYNDFENQQIRHCTTRDIIDEAKRQIKTNVDKLLVGV